MKDRMIALLAATVAGATVLDILSSLLFTGNVSLENDAHARPKVRELSTRLEHPSYVSTAAAPDVELGVLARDGDVQALAALLERWRPSLYATAVGLLGNRADASDAVQDTCVVALMRLGDLRDVAATRGWLHAVVRNVCLMRLRQRREISISDIELRDTVPGPASSGTPRAARLGVAGS